MKKITSLLICILIFNCNADEEKKVTIESNSKTVEIAKIPVLNLAEANRLAQLPLHCMDTEYPKGSRPLSWAAIWVDRSAFPRRSAEPLV